MKNSPIRKIPIHKKSYEKLKFVKNITKNSNSYKILRKNSKIKNITKNSNSYKILRMNSNS